jgi:hypothetical protein
VILNNRFAEEKDIDDKFKEFKGGHI